MGPILLGSASLLALLIALLAVPIEFLFKIERIKPIYGQVNVRWLFGLVRFSIDIPGTPLPNKTKAKRKPAAGKQADTRKAKPASANFFAVLKQSTFRRRLFQFIKDLLRATHLHELTLLCRIGLGDPADTGQLWAVLGPIAALSANMRGAAVRIEPAFMEQIFEVQSHGRFRLIPLEFIALTIAFVLSPPSLRAWRLLRQAKT